VADWAVFTGVTFVVLSLLLLLSRATRTAMTHEGGSIEPPTEERDLLRGEDADAPPTDRDGGPLDAAATDGERGRAPRAGAPDANTGPRAARRERGNPHNPFPPGSPSGSSVFRGVVASDICWVLRPPGPAVRLGRSDRFSVSKVFIIGAVSPA